jgi:ammonium transporter, Amt family
MDILMDSRSSSNPRNYRQSKRWVVVIIVWGLIVIVLSSVDTILVKENLNNFEIDSGDTAWMIVATAMVMLMSIPGLALYYGGFANKDSRINSMAMVFISYAITSVIWVFYGYGLSFGLNGPGDLIGKGRRIFLQGLCSKSISSLAPTIPEFVYVAFQLTFAAITVGLVSGALIERFLFRSWAVFCVLWLTFVYVPVAHWVWGQGYLYNIGVIDFAGGTVVHINSGVAALVGTIVLGKRIEPHEDPRNIVYIMTGTGLLWFGWFGFNAGSALTAGSDAGAALINTNTATSMSSLVWISLQTFHAGKPTLSGLCDGAISGLVGITPAAGYVNIIGAIVIGIFSGILPYWAIYFKPYLGYDDTLNTFGVHFISGAVGALLTGIYADPDIGDSTGLLFGNPKQFLWQLIGVVIVTAYSGIVTFIIMIILKTFIGIRVSRESEKEGIDKSQHGEYEYYFAHTSEQNDLVHYLE